MVFATGCASTGDVENLQAQIDALKPVVASAAADAASAKASADSAIVKASAAEVAADKAAKACADVNAKLDKLFKKTQFK
jgi:murein lipoprotein